MAQQVDEVDIADFAETCPRMMSKIWRQWKKSGLYVHAAL